MKKNLSISALNAENQIINDSQIKAAIPNTCVSIQKKWKICLEIKTKNKTS